MEDEHWTMKRSCEERGVARNTLERAIRDGKLTPLPWRDAKGGRVFSAAQVRGLELPGRGARSDLVPKTPAPKTRPPKTEPKFIRFATLPPGLPLAQCGLCGAVVSSVNRGDQTHAEWHGAQYTHDS